MDGSMGADFVARIRPSVVVPVHHDDYGVFRSFLSDFPARVEDLGLPAEVSVPRRGEVVSLES